MNTDVLEKKVDVREKQEIKVQGCETPLDDLDSDYEMRKFAEELKYRIIKERGEFFRSSYSDSDEQENEEVRQREARGEREFDYQRAISVLLENLAKMNPEERRKITEKVKQEIDYRESGIYVSSNGSIDAPLLADIAENPESYYNRFLFAPTLNRIIGMQKTRLHNMLDITLDNGFVDRNQNDELKQREAGGGRKFDYEKFIPALLENLAKMNSEERSRTRQMISLGVGYKLEGVVVNINWRDYPFADVAENPLKYFN